MDNQRFNFTTNENRIQSLDLRTVLSYYGSINLIYRWVQEKNKNLM